MLGSGNAKKPKDDKTGGSQNSHEKPNASKKNQSREWVEDAFGLSIQFLHEYFLEEAPNGGAVLGSSLLTKSTRS